MGEGYRVEENEIYVCNEEKGKKYHKKRTRNQIPEDHSRIQNLRTMSTGNRQQYGLKVCGEGKCK